MLSAAQVESLLRSAGIVCHVQSELGDGWFNTAFRAITDEGRRAVVKIAPRPGVPVLRYEHGILGTEAMFYHQVSTLQDVPMPELLHEGPGFLVVSELEGIPWSKATGRFTPEVRSSLLREVGRIAARIHAMPCAVGRFGCPASEAQLSSSHWRTAFTAMVEAILEDAERWDSPLGITPTEVRSMIARGSSALDEVSKPSLVHFDLWPGNIFVRSNLQTDGRSWKVTGLIDHERAFWGDPVAEMVSLEICGGIDPDSDLVAGYLEAGGQFDFTPSMHHRLALYRLYFGLILVVECGPRGYDNKHITWCRSKLDSWADQLRHLGIP